MKFKDIVRTAIDVAVNEVKNHPKLREVLTDLDDLAKDTVVRAAAIIKRGIEK